MTNTVPAQMTALAAIEATIAGVVHAFDAPPDAPPMDLPCFVNFPGPSNTPYVLSDDTGIEANETRTWECRLYVAPRGSGSLGEITRRCLPFFDLGRDCFEGHQSINSTAGVLRVTYLGDTGLNYNRLMYGGQAYSGIVFRVQITTRVRTPYAAGQ